MNGERSLWAAVLLQAIEVAFVGARIDARSIDLQVAYTKRSLRRVGMSAAKSGRSTASSASRAGSRAASPSNVTGAATNAATGSRLCSAA